MKLKRLTTKGLIGLPDTTFSFCEHDGGRPRPVTLITGGPQRGKTSLLRAIAAAKEAAGPYGAAPHPVKLVRPAPGARLDATWSLSEIEQRQSGEAQELVIPWHLSTGDLPEVSAGARSLFARFALNAERSKVELVPARRRIDATPETPLHPKLPEEQEGRARLRESSNKYGGALRAMLDATLEDARRTVALLDERGVAFRRDLPDSLAPYKAAVAKMCPSIRLMAVEPRERTRPLVWFQARDGARMELADLSDSEHQGFLFAAAFSWLGLHGSVVLVDTPELHIHPSDQVRFFQAICDLGTDNQIIAATTSPAILQSVTPEQVIDLSRPEKAA